MTLSRREFIGGLLGTALGTVVGDSLYRSQKRPGKVLVIGVDGLRPDALQEAVTPNIDTLVADGAYSFKARTGAYTVSGPGWSNILTGVWENKHGVKDNSFKGANYAQHPTIFTRIEDSKSHLNTHVVTSLDWFTELILPQADVKIYHPFEEEGDKKVAETASQLLSQHSVDLMFTYFMGVDEAGHAYGFDPKIPEYISEIETIDRYVGMLMGAIKKRSAYNQERWLIILTSDHGGKGKSHDGVGEEAMEVPLIMHGPAVEKGEIVSVPRQVDIAPTVLTYFGIPIQPEWGLDGKVVGLK
ncbi:MAG: alkaline phosphatase family protein [Nanoarchaeota archaeon]|nr:alkaline phosphatase family protein [Nanoarchaeota archaeon]